MFAAGFGVMLHPTLNANCAFRMGHRATDVYKRQLKDEREADHIGFFVANTAENDLRVSAVGHDRDFVAGGVDG